MAKKTSEKKPAPSKPTYHEPGFRVAGETPKAAAKKKPTTKAKKK